MEDLIEVVVRGAVLRHRGAHRIEIERLRAQALAHVFLRQAKIGLRGRDLLGFGVKLRAHDLGVGRRQARRDAVEAARQAVVDPRHCRQRHRPV